MRRLGLLAAMLLAIQLLVAVPAAHADPLPATYSGATSGDILSLGVTAASVITLDADLGHTETATDSTGDPRAHAESANLGADVAGVGVAVVSDEANSTTTTATDSYDTGLGDVDITGVLDTGLITGSGSTSWPGDLVCVPDGTPIAESEVELANADLGLTLAGVGLDVLSVGTVSTSGQTTLDGGSVVSTSAGDLTGLTLFNGLVDVDVLTNPTLTATSTGTANTVTANDYAVDVTIGGTTTELTAGASLPIQLTVGVLTIDATLTVGSVTDSSTATTASGSITFLTLTGAVDAPIVGEVASLDIGVLPLTASATAPAGDPDGVQCAVLDEAPVITVPASGATTGQTPTISGTGIEGASLTVYDTDGSTVIGTTTVGTGGAWSLVPATPLALGAHTITATQQVGDAVSGPSNAVPFTVVDQTAPAAPVITSPDDGSTTNDTTPTVLGTGEPGATVEVTIDGDVIGTAPVSSGGEWTLDVPTPLADGSHTATATQTDAAGNTSPVSDPVTFAIDATAPAARVITAPADGTVTSDPTPTITGTGEAGATIEVTANGTPVGTTVVEPDGTWSLVSAALEDGLNTLVATQTDPAGNESAESAPVDITVDTSAAPPVITSPEDGSTISDPTPTITGTGEPGGTVTVEVDGETVGTAPVGDDGTWSLELSDPLDSGSHTVLATQTDAAGNVSDPASLEFAVAGVTDSDDSDDSSNGSLAFTGASGGLAAVGLLGVLLSVAGVALRRRRR